MHGIRRIPVNSRVMVEIPETNLKHGAGEEFPHRAEARVARSSNQQKFFDRKEGLIFVEFEEEFVGSYIDRRFLVNPRFIGKRPRTVRRAVNRMWVPVTFIREL